MCDILTQAAAQTTTTTTTTTAVTTATTTHLLKHSRRGQVQAPSARVDGEDGDPGLEVDAAGGCGVQRAAQEGSLHLREQQAAVLYIYIFV